MDRKLVKIKTPIEFPENVYAPYIPIQCVNYKDCDECVQIIEYESADKHPNGCGKCGRSNKTLKMIEEYIG